MTNKFKVGDRVTLSGVVTAVGHGGSKDESHWPYDVMIDGDDIVSHFSASALQDTTFRDQAAIAILNGVLQRGHYFDCGTEVQKAFNIAEALDAERKKRDGV